MFYPNIDIISNNIVFNIFPYSREVEVIRYLFKYFFNSLIPTKVFYFIVDLKDLILSINRNINSFLEGKKSKIYLSK